MGQITVDTLIQILRTKFSGDEPVWFRVSDDPDCCYREVWDEDVRNSGVMIDEDEHLCQCIIGDPPV